MFKMNKAELKVNWKIKKKSKPIDRTRSASNACCFMLHHFLTSFHDRLSRIKWSEGIERKNGDPEAIRGMGVLSTHYTDRGGKGRAVHTFYHKPHYCPNETGSGNWKESGQKVRDRWSSWMIFLLLWWWWRSTWMRTTPLCPPPHELKREGNAFIILIRIPSRHFTPRILLYSFLYSCQ